MFEIRHYVAAGNKDLIAGWLRKLDDLRAKAAIIRRLNRLEQGNFGDLSRAGKASMSCESTPGQATASITRERAKLLCCCCAAGSKRTQDADIRKACEYWRDWQNRKE